MTQSPQTNAKGFSKAFWVSNTVELFERMAYYAVFIVLTIYLSNILGFNDFEASMISGLFSGGLYLLPIFTGAYADKIGFRKSMIIAFSLLSAGYLGLGVLPTLLEAAGLVEYGEITRFSGLTDSSERWMIVPVLFVIMLGGSFIKSIISASVAKETTEATRARGYSIFYMMVNFGYGYSERALCGKDPSSDFVTKLLDRGCQDRPVVLLCESSVSCILNSAASDIVRETAEEEMVQYVTTPYILGLFVPFDFEETQKAAKDLMTVSLAKGVTACLGAGAPDYFDTLYQETLMSLHNEENLNQRFYSSYMMNRPLFPKGVIHRLMARKTMCNEIDGLINSDICHVYLNAPSCPVEFSFDSLKKILAEVADKGFSIYVTAVDSEDLDMAAGSLEYIRNKGYKNLFVIDSPHRIDTSDFVH